MIIGKQVYDPITQRWSTGYWMAVYDRLGHVVQYVPVWAD